MRRDIALRETFARPCPTCGATAFRLCVDLPGETTFADNRALAGQADMQGDTDKADQLRTLSIHEDRLPDGVSPADLSITRRM
jgi:hypothetical protein